MHLPVTPTSAMMPTTPAPPEVRRWNWGAFFLTWIWGIGNNVLIAFLVWVPFLNLVMPIILGIKGGEWAWQKKRWDSLEHFQRVQRIWAWIGFAAFLFFLLTMIAAFSLLVSLFRELFRHSDVEVMRVWTDSLVHFL